ncbi:MAG: hypothetical protein UD936_00720 [Acutalibacteraceae bacterium]|nr:hypothetical protein [Acutalibacteraceae bacterium]
MKEYIKPQIELLEYSFDDIIAWGSTDGPADSGSPEIGVPVVPGDDIDEF